MNDDASHCDHLEDGLAEAFGKDAVGIPSHSVLDALQSRAQSSLGVHLDSQGPDDVPVKVTDEARQLRDPSGRYQVLGEIGRGGVGVVYKGRDQDLGRDVAMKVLRDDYAERPEVLARFVEEAQIGGQLQHPGIVPVYELGLQSGERPYFAMKLVKGETLSAQLARRSDLSDDRRRFLGVFEQVCQTLAYAHSRNVVHRDLKPANVMTGAFGEVQVVDWGFAKVLSKGGVADEANSLSRSNERSVIETVRSTPGSGSNSVAGSVLGTPAYMPPEQALGDVENLDTRSDVFGLGAILCEILTGSPPYRSEDGDLVRQAVSAQLDGAYTRLRSSGAAEAVVALCIECLSKARQARPSSAAEVAERIAAHLTSVEERARQAELRAAEARYKQRTTMLSAGAGILILILSGSAWLWSDLQARQRREEASTSVATATSGVREARGQALAAVLDMNLWDAAVDDAIQLVALAQRENIEQGVRGKAVALLAMLRQERDTAAQEAERLARDQKMLERLTMLRLPSDHDVRHDDWETKEYRRLSAGYAEAFAAYLGASSIFDQPVETVLTSLRRGDHAAELAASLDHWALLRDGLLDGTEAELRPDATRTARIRELATFLDHGDEWRSELRSLLPDAANEAARLVDLSGRADFAALSPASSRVLAIALWRAGAEVESISALQRAREHHPQDFDLCFSLALAYELQEEPDWEAVVATQRIAQALHPGRDEVLHRQAMALRKAGQPEAAERVFRILLSRHPDHAHWMHHVANVLQAQGRSEEAISTYQTVVANHPGYNASHHSLGKLLYSQGKLAEAVSSYRRAIAIEPGKRNVHHDLGNALKAQGKLEEAAASYRREIEHHPLHRHSQHALGYLLLTQGQLDEAEFFLRSAVDIDPSQPQSHANLGTVLERQGKLEEALCELNDAYEIFSERSDSYAIEWSGIVFERIERLEQLLSRQDEYQAIARGEQDAGTGQDWMLAAEWAYRNHQHAQSVSTYSRGFEAAPELLAQPPHPYNAACAAALAGGGMGHGAEDLSDMDRAEMRLQARDWLACELARLTRLVAADASQREEAIRKLQWLYDDQDLAGVRDSEALATLPAAEAGNWHAFWRDVGAALERLKN